MLAVDAAYRKRSIGSTLVKKAIEAMRERNAEVIQERRNFSAAALYQYPQERANWSLRTQAR